MNVIKTIEDHKRQEITTYPVRSNWASQLGHPCLKFLVYQRLNWQEKRPISLQKKMLFDEGKHQEKRVLLDMQEAGIEVIQTQQPFSWEKYLISGRIDGIIRNSGEEIPFEIKSMAPYFFDAVNSEGDLWDGKWYYRNYLAQLTLYLLMSEKEFGLFIFKNKSNGQLKQIEYPLVFEFGEGLIKKAILINNYVEKKKYPDPMEYRPEICDGCEFAHICTPPKEIKEIEVIPDTELADMLDRKEQLKEAMTELKGIEKQVKQIMTTRQKVICGNWIIEKIVKSRKEYTVPAGDYEQLKYIHLKGGVK